MKVNKICTFMNGPTAYEVYGICRTTRHGLSLLLKTPAGNWIVANGVNVRCEKGFLVSEGYAFGDWDHGHYFMEHEHEARMYFRAVKETEVLHYE